MNLEKIKCRLRIGDYLWQEITQPLIHVEQREQFLRRLFALGDGVPEAEERRH